MTNDLYCSMIHGGLHLNIDGDKYLAQSCCIRNERNVVDSTRPIWQQLTQFTLRQTNVNGVWDDGCHNCHKLEKAGMTSFRQGMNEGLGIFGQYDLSGPARIDLKFDISCNLACRTCGPHSSTFWQRHLRDNNEWNQPIFSPRRKEDVISILSSLDLSNLRQVVFCGGETMLGHEYWAISKWLVEHVPNAKDQLTLCFQTNGTQPISPRNFEIIEKAHLVKLHISMDGVGKRFEYLRWPASWAQTVDNIMSIRSNAPSNVMFVIEETISIFNLYYLEETQQWHTENFSVNKEGDPINLTRHLAEGIYSLESCSQDYVDALKDKNGIKLIPSGWKEDQSRIKQMLQEIKKFDGLRGQDFSSIFPEVFEMYRKFL